MRDTETSVTDLRVTDLRRAAVRPAGHCAEWPAAAFSRPKRFILLLIPRDVSGKANHSVSVTRNGKERD